jgi:hypothetical protein
MLGRREAIARRCRREAEARVVGRDAPEPVPEALDDVAVLERPRGVAVEEQQRRSGALVDVVDTGAVDVRIATTGRCPTASARVRK